MTERIQLAAQMICCIQTSVLYATDRSTHLYTISTPAPCSAPLPAVSQLQRINGIDWTAICVTAVVPLKPRLHTRIHVAGYRYPCRATCIRIQVDTSGYMSP